MRKILVVSSGAGLEGAMRMIYDRQMEDLVVVCTSDLTEDLTNLKELPSRFSELKDLVSKPEFVLPPSPAQYFDEPKNFITGKVLPHRKRQK